MVLEVSDRSKNEMKAGDLFADLPSTIEVSLLPDLRVSTSDSDACSFAKAYVYNGKEAVLF